jgi:4'-phosphopantetheinyl transferase EntD
MLQHLLPAQVAWADARTDEVPPGALFSQERDLVAGAVGKRQREFATVRVCARRALAAVGFPPAPLLRGPRGEPLWPHGVVGSMTHCAGYYAAAVARATDVRAIGIDAEPHDRLPDGVLEAIALPAERMRLADRRGQTHWDRLLFSAKESVFKAWYPGTRVGLTFEDADITFCGEASADGSGWTGGAFHVRLRRAVPSAPPAFDGRWIVRDGLALTAVVVTAN